MAKPRRNIKFNHRNGQASGIDGGRRSSFSDISEETSGEPVTEKQAGTGTDIAKEVCAVLQCYAARHQLMRV